MFKFALASLVLAACATDTAIVPDDVDPGKADGLHTAPHGIYTYEPTLAGLPQSGDILRLELTPSRQFQLDVSDEISGTTTHRGRFELFRTADETGFFIDFIEGAQRTRVEYSIDVVDDATLWLHPSDARGWYGMWFLGDDCTTGGCGAGSTCESCFGETVCMPAGTGC